MKTMRETGRMIRKDMLKEHHIPGNKGSMSQQIQELVTFLSVWISQKNTRHTPRLKLILEPRGIAGKS